MPRKKHGLFEALGLRPANLVEELAREIKNSRDFGQPMIDEQLFPTNAISVRVIWDKWDHVPHDLRSVTILGAYRLAEGEEYCRRIALATGLTVPEARASGLLPYQIIAAVRADDPVTEQQCRDAMIEEGASLLFDTGPRLCLPTEADAEEAVTRLTGRLPGSGPVWVITREVGQPEDWPLAESS